MNKRDLVTTVARNSDYTRREVQEIISKTFEVILENLRRGNKVGIVNFGTFKLKRRKPRKGYNPKTKEKIEIPEKVSVAFSPTGKFEMEEQ